MDLFCIFCVDRLTEMERARVIFHYITAQNLNELPGLPEDCLTPDVDNPGEALAGLKTGKIHYSKLYQHLCTQAKLKCKIVEGKVKGANWSSGTDLSDFENSWNAVKVDGQYHLVDSHWGSRHISSNEGQEVNYCYEEFYFFPEPEELISTRCF